MSSIEPWVLADFMDYGVGLGEIEGYAEGVGVGTTAGPTVTADPRASRRIVTFFPEAPDPKVFILLYVPPGLAPCCEAFQVSFSALIVSSRRTREISETRAPMKLLPPDEPERPPPKSTVPSNGIETIAGNESSNAYLARLPNLSPETETSMLASVIRSTTFPEIVLSPPELVKVTDGNDGALVGVPVGDVEGVAEGYAVETGTVSEKAPMPKSLPWISQEAQLKVPPGTSTPLTPGAFETVPEPKLAVPALNVPRTSSDQYAARELGSFSFEAPT
jgi:hypothetical protein